jgi:hypothetical protein
MADDRMHDELRDQPIGELLNQLSQETATLVRQELDLARPRWRRRASGQVWARACSAARA